MKYESLVGAPPAGPATLEILHVFHLFCEKSHVTEKWAVRDSNRPSECQATFLQSEQGTDLMSAIKRPQDNRLKSL